MNTPLDSASENIVRTTENEALTRAVYDALMNLTGEVAGAEGVAAMSVIYQGLQIWAMELSAIEPNGTGDYLRALADLLDPPEVKVRRKGRAAFAAESESRRREAIRKIYASALLQISLARRANGDSDGAKAATLIEKEEAIRV